MESFDGLRVLKSLLKNLVLRPDDSPIWIDSDIPGPSLLPDLDRPHELLDSSRLTIIVLFTCLPLALIAEPKFLWMLRFKL